MGLAGPLCGFIVTNSQSVREWCAPIVPVYKAYRLLSPGVRSLPFLVCVNVSAGAVLPLVMVAAACSTGAVWLGLWSRYNPVALRQAVLYCAGGGCMQG